MEVFELTKASSLYAVLVAKMCCRCWSDQGKFNERMISLRKLVKIFLERTVCVFQESFEPELFMMKVHYSGICARSWKGLEL